MRRAVFDSSTIVIYLTQERPFWKAIDRTLNHPDLEPVLAGPPLTEIITTTRRKGNTTAGAHIWAALSSLGAVIENPTPDDLIRAAALIELSDANPGPANSKGSPATLSLGDALILGIAERLGCPVLTNDTYWEWMVNQGLLAVTVHVPA